MFTLMSCTVDSWWWETAENIGAILVYINVEMSAELHSISPRHLKAGLPITYVGPEDPEGLWAMLRSRFLVHNHQPPPEWQLSRRHRRVGES